MLTDTSQMKIHDKIDAVLLQTKNVGASICFLQMNSVRVSLRYNFERAILPVFFVCCFGLIGLIFAVIETRSCYILHCLV